MAPLEKVGHHDCIAVFSRGPAPAARASLGSRTRSPTGAGHCRHVGRMRQGIREYMAAIVVRIRTIGPIRTICPKWSDSWSEFDFWFEFSIDDTHA